MKEQSHKEEMSAALRGDFQRLRERGVSPALAPHDAPEPEESPSGDEPSPDARLEAGFEPPPAEPSTAPPAEPADDAAPPRRGWLSRLAGR